MINVRYISSSLSPSGYGEAARQFVTALFSAGVNVSCENIMQMAEITDYGIPGMLCDKLQHRDISYKINIIHLTPDLLPQYKEKGIYTISHLFWETDKLPKEWIEPLNDIDEIWTGSKQMAEMIRNSGVTTTCYTFSQPIDVTKAEERIEPFLLEIPRDFIFYTIGQWIDRKNFRGLLRAYWKAFSENDKVSLLLKTFRVNYTESEYTIIKRDIQKWKEELNLKHYPKLLISRQLLSEKQVDKLHSMGDVYVSASSGEGWARPVQEAMLFGKPVISGDNGGITDIVTNIYYYKVNSFTVKATENPSIPWYTSDQHWKELDEVDLGKKMKEVYENYTEAQKVGKKAQEYVMNNFNYQIVGQQMKKRLEEISELL